MGLPGADAGHVQIPFQYWIWFGALVFVLLFLDLTVFHRKVRQIRMREALGWTVFYVALALAFNVWVYIRFGHQKGLEFLTGYIIEESLSVDNIFVFVVLFRYFRVKPEYQHRVLFWGILATIVMRLLFILAGRELFLRFHLVVYVFGVLLLYSGFKLLFGKDEEFDPQRNLAYRLFKRYIPMTHEYEGPKFIVKRGGKRYATDLLLVLVVLNFVDLIFAVDSVPAILAITTDTFIVYTSNIFAILGLRSIYFFLAGMMDVFHLLKVGLSLILIFIGMKMLLQDVVDISVPVSLGVVGGVLATSVIASLLLPRRPRAMPPEEEPPPGPAEEG